MDSDEVIVIEDTPPSSPNSKKPNENMYYQHQNLEFPSAEQAMIWSRNTTNFIKQSMNSVQQNNHMPLLNNNMQNVRQNNPMAFVNMPMPNRPFLPRNGYPYNGIRGFPRPPYTISNYNPYTYYQSYRFGPMGNAPLLNNLYNTNFWMKVKLEELPDKGEIVSQYYIDETQTPVKMNNYQNENIMPPIPEYVDITTLANKLQNQQLVPNVTRFPATQTNENSLTLSTEIDDKKRNKNPVPLFLKRNRPVNNKMKLSEENHKNDISSNNNEDSDDIIFIGEYKNNDKLPQISEVKEDIINNSIESNSQNETNSSDQSFKEETKDTETNTDTKYSYKCGKRKRKDRNLLPLRRNPKRQVQIEKEFLKMIDDVITESDKEEKLKKIPNIKQNKPAAKTAVKFRRSPRVLSNSGAVYNPPSPLTNAHIRDWPAEGMHERPEFNPVTGKIEPFDHFIRNISDEFHAGKSPDEIIVKAPIDLTSNIKENEKSFPELCHEMLHHVLAYVATVKAIARDENKASEDNEEKNLFLQKLELTKNNETIEEKICGILQSIVDDIISPKYEQKPDDHSLVELLKNTILIYCLTNNVDQSDVATYIASVKPEDIIRLSYEQFNLDISEH